MSEPSSERHGQAPQSALLPLEIQSEIIKYLIDMEGKEQTHMEIIDYLHKRLCISKHILPIIIKRLYQTIDLTSIAPHKKVKIIARALERDSTKASYVETIIDGDRNTHNFDNEREHRALSRIFKCCKPTTIKLYIYNMSPFLLQSISIARLRTFEICCQGTNPLIWPALACFLERTSSQLDMLSVGSQVCAGLAELQDEPTLDTLKRLTLLHCNEDEHTDDEDEEESLGKYRTLYQTFFHRYGNGLIHLDILGLQNHAVLGSDHALDKLGTFPKLETLVFDISSDSAVWYNELLDIRAISSLKKLIIKRNYTGELLECIQAFKALLEGPFAVRECRFKLRELDLTDLDFSTYMSKHSNEGTRQGVAELQKVCLKKKMVLLV